MLLHLWLSMSRCILQSFSQKGQIGDGAKLSNMVRLRNNLSVGGGLLLPYQRRMDCGSFTFAGEQNFLTIGQLISAK